MAHQPKMKPVYATSDAQIILRCREQQKISLLDSCDQLLQPAKVEINSGVAFHIHSNMIFGDYTITGDSINVQIELQHHIFCYDLIDGGTYSYDIGNEFAIMFANVSRYKTVQQPIVVSVQYNPFMPPLEIGASADLYFLPLCHNYQPTITIGEQRYVHHNSPDENSQSYCVGPFDYQYYYFPGFEFKNEKYKHEIAGIDFLDGIVQLSHRGCGSNKDYRQIGNQYLAPREGQHQYLNQVAENTILSYNLALQRLDGVELDVILTKDHIPVINHDFGIESDFGKVPINGITLEQFKKLEIPRLHKSAKKVQDDSYRPIGETDNNTYWTVSCERVRPTFKEVLQKVAKNKIINVEIKYPSKYCNSIGSQYFSRSRVILEILKLMDQYPERQAYFSSFDPGIVYLLKQCQSKYPVFYLNMGVGQYQEDEDMDFDLDIVRYAQKGADYAARIGIVGMVISMQIVREMPDVVKCIRDRNLEVFTWGTLCGDLNWQKKQEEMGIKGIIYDLALLKK